MMSDEELNEETQYILRSDAVATPRERAERAVAFIGRQIGQEIGGLVGAAVWGATAIKRPKVSRDRWKFLFK